MKRILVKDYTNRIDWKELFEYTITESGEIYAPGVSPSNTAQFGLRASIRNASNFGSGGLSFPNNSSGYGAQFNGSNSGTSSSTNSSMNNDSMKGNNSPLLSPKPNKEEDNRNYLMKKKSPLKIDEVPPVGNGNSGINTSINYGTNLIKNEQYAKNDRNNRL